MQTTHVYGLFTYPKINYCSFEANRMGEPGRDAIGRMGTSRNNSSRGYKCRPLLPARQEKGEESRLGMLLPNKLSINLIDKTSKEFLQKQVFYYKQEIFIL